MKDHLLLRYGKSFTKTMCTVITNIVVNAIATENMLSVSDEGSLTAEVQ